MPKLKQLFHLSHQILSLAEGGVYWAQTFLTRSLLSFTHLLKFDSFILLILLTEQICVCIQ